MYSVVILTLNEERNLAACLDSAKGSDDIVVLDSGSTDQTCDIALKSGARVVTNSFRDFAQQRNFAHTSILFRHPWVFHLDADERMTEELHRECLALSSQDNPFDGYWVAPKMMFQGKWIPRCTDFPAWQARFAHVSRFRFIQVGHGQREDPAMRMDFLAQNYFHDLSSDGEAEWVEKHRRYARAEAAAIVSIEGNDRSSFSRLFSKDRLARRRALKRLSYALPARPWLRFIYQYGLRRGFLDGTAGLRYCRLLSNYEAWTDQEIKKLRANPGK